MYELPIILVMTSYAAALGFLDSWGWSFSWCCWSFKHTSCSTVNRSFSVPTALWVPCQHLHDTLHQPVHMTCALYGVLRQIIRLGDGRGLGRVCDHINWFLPHIKVWTNSEGIGGHCAKVYVRVDIHCIMMTVQNVFDSSLPSQLTQPYILLHASQHLWF